MFLDNAIKAQIDGLRTELADVSNWSFVGTSKVFNHPTDETISWNQDFLSPYGIYPPKSLKRPAPAKSPRPAHGSSDQELVPVVQSNNNKKQPILTNSTRPSNRSSSSSSSSQQLAASSSSSSLGHQQQKEKKNKLKHDKRRRRNVIESDDDEEENDEEEEIEEVREPAQQQFEAQNHVQTPSERKLEYFEFVTKRFIH